MVNGITFSEQLITSTNFAHFMYTFLNHANGITKGCEVSHANGTVYVQKGYFYGVWAECAGGRNGRNRIARRIIRTALFALWYLRLI